MLLINLLWTITLIPLNTLSRKNTNETYLYQWCFQMKSDCHGNDLFTLFDLILHNKEIELITLYLILKGCVFRFAKWNMSCNLIVQLVLHQIIYVNEMFKNVLIWCFQVLWSSQINKFKMLIPFILHLMYQIYKEKLWL